MVPNTHYIKKRLRKLKKIEALKKKGPSLFDIQNRENKHRLH